MSRFIRLRGLPWSVTHQEILDFLKDCNVVEGPKGINLVTSRWDGKNTGEAFVELESEQDEDEAFKHNKETLGHRYIEIFKASNEEAEHAVKKTGSAPSNVVKLRGLPYAVTEEMIEEFFNGLEIKPDREGILIVMDRRVRATGEAYVQFETQEDTEQALKRNRDKIGHRYIEIFRSSIAEMRRQSSGSRPGPYDKKDRGGNRNDFANRNSVRGNSRGGDIWANNFSNNGGGGAGFGSNCSGAGNSRGNFNGNGNGDNGGFNSGFGDFNNFGNSGGGGNNFNSGRNFDSAFGPTGGTVNTGNFGNSNFGGGGFSDNARNNSIGDAGGNFGPIGGGRNDTDLFCVHMRGLPYNSFENEVFKFFDPIRPTNVKINYNNKGLHSGTADALFENYDDAMDAMKRNRDQMGNRYIELFFDGKSKGGNNAFSRRI